MAMSAEQVQTELMRATSAAGSLLPLLPRLAGSEWEALVETFRPRPGDCALAFLESGPFEEMYDKVWSNIPKRSGVAPDQTEVRAVAATTALLRDTNPISGAFPGGYARIAHLLAPDRVWVAWKYVRPGQTAGMAFDGLVQIGDRWVWFPHPWRAIRTLAHQIVPDA